MSGELLMLMLLPLAGAAAQDPRYQITQPGYLSAPAGGSVTLPCNFTYPREIEPLQDLRVYWRLGFFGQFIYNHTERFTRPDYGGRIVLVGDPRGSRMASIRIARLWVLDAGVYVCHITVRKNNGQWEQWRHHPGTQLTVTGRHLLRGLCPGPAAGLGSRPTERHRAGVRERRTIGVRIQTHLPGAELSARHPGGMTPSSSCRMVVILQQNTR
ncbi:paired immunoglobulin-like type 2 receptor alpha isoform X2 [Caretta caretta]|uniref:paired immunoglobulin-like type 2 receptor alpha isoform X2 n=1 Tax=Caretta caretta TaxID=8467 RepID=UPI003F4C3E6B